MVPLDKIYLCIECFNRIWDPNTFFQKSQQKVTKIILLKKFTVKIRQWKLYFIRDGDNRRSKSKAQQNGGECDLLNKE